MKKILLSPLLCCMATASLAQAAADSFVPKEGLVPTADVAIKIAVAIWEPIYGAKKIEGEKPFKATLRNGVWFVEGSLPEGWLGGVAHAEISQKDGQILRVIHTQ